MNMVLTLEIPIMITTITETTDVAIAKITENTNPSIKVITTRNHLQSINTGAHKSAPSKVI